MALGSTFAALRHRNYRIWAGAGFVSVIGTWMQVLGVNWYVLEQTRSATSMGLAVLLQSLPTLLLSVWGGVLADRLPAKPLLVAAQALHALLAAGLAVVAVTGAGGLPAIYVIALVTGAVSAIEGPVSGRWSSTLVNREDLGNALALGSLTNSAGRILGMSAGAVVVAAAGPALLFAINAASFIAVVAALLAVREQERHQGGDAAMADAPVADGGIRAGFRYLLRQPVVLVALGLSFVLGSLGRNYQVTMAAMSDGPLGGGASGYGVLSTVFAVGTVLGALVAARRRELGYRMLIGAGLVASVLQIAAGLAPGTLSFAAVILPVAAAAVVIDTTVGARAQLDTDYAMRGRVLAALAVTGSVSAAIGAPLLGWLSEHAGPRQTLVLAGVVTVVATVAAGVVLDGLRDQRVRRRITRVLTGPAVRQPARRVAAVAARVPRPALVARVARSAGPPASPRSAGSPPPGTYLAKRRPGVGRMPSGRLVTAAYDCAGGAPVRPRRHPRSAGAAPVVVQPVDCLP